MRSLEGLEAKFTNGEATEGEIDLLARYYKNRTRAMFWDIVDLKRLKKWEEAEKKEEELKEMDKREASFYEYLIFYLEENEGPNT
jgi:hypothetical protein